MTGNIYPGRLQKWYVCYTYFRKINNLKIKEQSKQAKGTKGYLQKDTNQTYLRFGFYHSEF